MEGYDIVRHIKLQRIRWLRHVERMEEDRMPKKIYKEKLFTKKRRGRPRKKWIDDVKED